MKITLLGVYQWVLVHKRTRKEIAHFSIRYDAMMALDMIEHGMVDAYSEGKYEIEARPIAVEIVDDTAQPYTTADGSVYEEAYQTKDGKWVGYDETLQGWIMLSEEDK